MHKTAYVIFLMYFVSSGVCSPFHSDEPKVTIYPHDPFATKVYEFAASHSGGLPLYPMRIYGQIFNSLLRRYIWYGVRFRAAFAYPPYQRTCEAKVQLPKVGRMTFINRLHCY